MENLQDLSGYAKIVSPVLCVWKQLVNNISGAIFAIIICICNVENSRGMMAQNPQITRSNTKKSTSVNIV